MIPEAPPEPGTPEPAEGAAPSPPPPRVPASVLVRRLPWADLLQRTFALDVLECTRCGGRMRVLAFITEPATIRRILAHLSLPIEMPRPAPARGPPEAFPGWPAEKSAGLDEPPAFEPDADPSGEPFDERETWDA